MDREIKFRAYDKKNKKMVTGFSFHFTTVPNTGGWGFTFGDINYCNENKVTEVPNSDDLVS